ncbi:MAG: PilZ domain-containing protein [Pseudobacteriovorax sp.]|nr:PilZ domain-containing protein [Pseudobacteriovorax sp.]
MGQGTDNSDRGFDVELINKYPRSNRRLSVNIARYGISIDNKEESGQTVHISPHGIQFRSVDNFSEGDLLKVHVNLPNYWERKQRFVDYGRIDTPNDFKILVKVVSSEEIGKRGKKKMIICRTVNMDQVDEQVLKAFLQEG